VISIIKACPAVFFVPVDYGSASGSGAYTFLQRPSRFQQKISLFSKVFFVFPKVDALTEVFKDN
jgi:hypothetical protein